MELKLEIRNLACGYGSERLLQNINFSLYEGEVLCILGPNGAGKTTLFKTILGLMKKQDGQVLLKGVPIESKQGKLKSKGIAYVPQAHYPTFPFQVRDIVVMGRTAEMKAFTTPSAQDYMIAEQMLDQLGLLNLKNRDYTAISGGERQLVLIARAMAQKPDILIMDEPAASLDYGNQAKLLKRIKQLSANENLGVIMTSHSPDHAFLVADKVMLINTDRSIMIGDADEIVTSEHLSKAYGTDIKIIKMVDDDGELLRSCLPKI
jgi:iron complex transport system ATP-binding protein